MKLGFHLLGREFRKLAFVRFMNVASTPCELLADRVECRHRASIEMNAIEIRDLDEARRYVLQGLWLHRAIVPPPAGNLRTYLEWALEIASSGDPLPPVGFIADVGVAAFGMDRGEKSAKADATEQIGLPSKLIRIYEDNVLGKIYGDWTFERAADALKSYAAGRERARGLAFLVGQFRKRAKFGGVLLSPSVIRTMLDPPAEETLKKGLESLQNDGLMPILEEAYEQMVEAARRTAEILTESDVRALENRIALADQSQQLAHDQIMEASKVLRRRIPESKVKPLATRQEVPTHVLDEDTYPVGGFASISTRGSIESLLHSQLAYMEQSRRPDMFDMKYLRDELYYYSRDENQFLRRRRTFVFVLYPDLVQARFQDPDIPDRELRYQRIVLLMGLIHAAVERLTLWLSGDALKFDFVFPHEEGSFPLKLEYELLEMLFREQIENQTISLYPAHDFVPGATPVAAREGAKPRVADRFQRIRSERDVVELCQDRARKSMCHCLTLSMRDRPLEIENTSVTRLQMADAVPTLAHSGDDEAVPMDEWHEALERLLQIWV